MTLVQRLWRFHRDTLGREIQKCGGEKGFFVPERLVFVVTTRCNFACKHCLRSLEDPSDLPLDIALRTLEDARKFNFRALAITGGEPFVYPHLEAVTERAAALDYKIGLVTNGFEFLEHADYVRHYRKSFSYVAFSLESADPGEHDAIRRKGSFARLMDAFAFCHKERVPFRVQTTIGRHNIGSLLDIALLVKKKRVPYLSFTTMLPCPRTTQNNLVLDAKQREDLVLDLLSLRRTLRLQTNIAADIRANANVLLCHPLAMREVAVDAQGCIIQCCEVGNYDDPAIRRFASIADLKENSFPEALKKLSAYLHRFTCARIDDYAKKPGRDESPDFNSCFYCIQKIGALARAPR